VYRKNKKNKKNKKDRKDKKGQEGSGKIRKDKKDKKNQRVSESPARADPSLHLREQSATNCGDSCPRKRT
jgi:hypothetical protein